MNSENFETRLEQLFESVCDLPPEKRREVLDSECRDEPELRRHLEALLARDADGSSEFLTGALDFAGSGEPEDLEGTVGDGRYELIRLLGEGGMGVVYLARQTEPVRRQVALKLIKLGMDSRQVLARFEAEQQALAIMDHPGLAKVFDAGLTEKGRPYFAMEYVEGLPITDYCDRHRLSRVERLQLFMLVCDAIDHAHQHGIIHRDIKPSNVLVTRQGNQPVPKVIDFGVAKATRGGLTENTLVTEQGQIIGTPEYMSPEQTVLGGQAIDTRTDVYSLGALLYELLTGAPPIAASILRNLPLDELCRKIREEEPAKPSSRLLSLESDRQRELGEVRSTTPATLLRTVRGDLDWITLKALSKSPRDRYGSVSALGDDIRRHLRNEPVLAGPPDTLYLVRKFARRHRGLVAALGSIFLTMIVATAVSVSYGIDAHIAAGQARWNAYIAHLAAADSALKAYNVSSARRMLEKIDAPQNESWEYRNLEQRLDMSSRVIRVPASAGAGFGQAYAGCLDLSADGSRLVSGTTSGDGHSHLWDTNSGELLHTLHADGVHEDQVWAVAFSPDGLHVATGSSDKTIAIWEVASGRLVAHLVGHEGSVVSLAYHPEGKLLASGSGDKSIRIWDLGTNQVARQLDGHESHVRSVAFHPDGQRLVSASQDQTVRVWSLETGDEIRVFNGHTKKVWSVSIHPEGRLVASTSGATRIWDIETGEQLRVIGDDSSDGVNFAEFSRDGSFVATTGRDLEVRVWNTRDGRLQRSFLGHTGLLSMVTYGTPHVLATASTDGSLRVWEPVAFEGVHILTGNKNFVNAADFSPGDETLVTASRDGTLRFWDALSGCPIAALEVGCSGYGADFSPDGGQFVVGCSDNTAQVRRSDTGDLVHSLPHDDGVLRTLFSPDGSLIATRAKNGAIRIWNAATGELAQLLGVHEGRATDLDWDPTGAYLLANDGQVVHVWDVARGEDVLQLELTESIMAVDVHPEGRLVATAAMSGNVYFWSFPDGTLLETTLNQGSPVFDVRFDRGGDRLAVAAYTGVVHLWDTGRWDEVTQLQGHPYAVAALAYSNRGDILATGSARTTRLWSTRPLTDRLEARREFLRAWSELAPRIEETGATDPAVVLAALDEKTPLTATERRAARALLLSLAIQ